MPESADRIRSPLVLPRGPGSPAAVVLFLHGGRESGLTEPPGWNLPGLRMRPFERRVRRAYGARGVLVGRVRYRCRGWNGERADAAQDARRAVDDLAARYPDVPVVLVGHSMGGRAALRAAGHPSVRAVVGLAPWCPKGEPVAHLRGRTVVVLHGDQDRTTDPAASEDFVSRAVAAGATARLLRLHGTGHTMLRRAGAWHSLTTDTVGGLLGLAPLPDAVERGRVAQEHPQEP